MFKTRVFYEIQNHRWKPECFRSDKARTARFLNDLKNEPLYTQIHEESLKINVSWAAKIWEKYACFYEI